MTEQHDTLRVERAGGVMSLTLDHPPLNLLDGAVIGDRCESPAGSWTTARRGWS